MVQANKNDERELKERLIFNVKREVKQLMEEAVTKKFIYEESNVVTAVCAAVEACLCQGLRRRALGLFKTSSTTALLHKISKSCSEAGSISEKIQQLENIHLIKKSHSTGSDSVSKTRLQKKGSASLLSPPNPSKFLWIRLALFEKKLAKIVEFLATHADNYYEKDALIADPDYGLILSSLLVGPCALEFTQTKTCDHWWADLHADELVQRHRISSGNSSSIAAQNSIINFKRSFHANSEDPGTSSFKASPSITVAKSCVESLHQNSKAILLYGKNNVTVLPKDSDAPLPGYLSLHQNLQSLIIKWTPNQLMNGCNDSSSGDQSSLWSYALNIDVSEIVYVHCHQNRGEDSGGSIVFVGQDGVQYHPIHFPEGGNMQTFLSRLETGLLPHGQLDPPLWSQKGISALFQWPKFGRGRILSARSDSSEEIPVDYVFRIVSKSNHEDLLVAHSVLDIGRTSPRRRTQLSSCSTNESSDYSSKSISIDQVSMDSPPIQTNRTISIEQVCSTMRRQIISRSFYGWLAYCRHLSTVRTHLSGLVNRQITLELASDKKGLTHEIWENLNIDGVLTNEKEIYRLVYFGGVDEEIRKEVWPYLLGHYTFGSTPEERKKLDEQFKHYYETTMSEWLAVEAIVRQRDIERTAKAVAKLSSGSGSIEKSRYDLDIEGENEVFAECDSTSNQEEDLTDAEQQARLSSTVARDIKHSTDSGTVDDIDRQHELSPNGSKPKTSLPSSSEGSNQRTTFKAVSVDHANDSDAEDTRRGVLSYTDPYSPSSSSYETVTNDFIDCPENDVYYSKIRQGNNTQTFYSVEDISGSAPKDLNEGTDFKPMPVIITDASVDVVNIEMCKTEPDSTSVLAPKDDDLTQNTNVLQESKSNCVSPVSSNGGVYSSELLENFGLNLHRIEKDVQRCDRSYWYFADENLDKLRNVISTYVWEHLDVGYMQGMCDLVAPLLVIFDDESMSYSCFCKLMERMIENFPNGGAMDMHFANMRSLIQILDPEMYDLMDSHGDYTHFYFCYRWFLLDFKRELLYADVFSTWEVIWAAKHIASDHFVLFLALALLQTYRDIIISNNMDFTDVIKFFNEMAERHDARSVLQLARSLTLQLQMILEHK